MSFRRRALILSRPILCMCELVPLSPANVKFIFWACQIMRDLQAEEQSSKRQKTSCTSVSSPSNTNSSSAPRALSFSTTGTCSFPVTTTLTTTEGNVKEPIAGPSETDFIVFNILHLDLYIHQTPIQSVQGVSNRKKSKALTKQHNRLKKRFIKLH